MCSCCPCAARYNTWLLIKLTLKRIVFSFLQLLFRSVNKLLMDTATSEYLFCSDFFQEAAVFHELFAPTLQVVESALAATLPVGTHAPSCPEQFVSMLQAAKIGFGSNPSSQYVMESDLYSTSSAILLNELCSCILASSCFASERGCHW